MIERRPRVVLAEDEELTVLDLTEGLEAAGYAVIPVRDGRSAVETCLQVKPDAMVLDVGLPARDGFDVLAAVRKASTLRRMRVVMLTARHSAADVARALKLGADDYVAKPAHSAKLAARLGRLVPTKGPRERSTLWVD